MAGIKSVVDDAGKLLSLPPRPVSGTGIAYGAVDGFPVQVRHVKEGNNQRIEVLIRHDADQHADLIRRGLDNDSQLGKHKVRGKSVQFDAGLLVWKRAKGMRAIPASEVADVTRGLVTALRSVSSAPAGQCRHCGAAANDLCLVDGVVDRVCGACTVKLTADAEEVNRAYDRLPIRYGVAVPVGLVLALIGAAGWAGLTIATERMF